MKLIFFFLGFLLFATIVLADSLESKSSSDEVDKRSADNSLEFDSLEARQKRAIEVKEGGCIRDPKNGQVKEKFKIKT